MQLFIFTVVLDGSLWVGYFIYLKFASVNSIVYQSLHLIPIKETNWVINKGMRVLLFDVFKHLLLRKTDVLKTCWESKFLEIKFWRNPLVWWPRGATVKFKNRNWKVKEKQKRKQKQKWTWKQKQKWKWKQKQKWKWK